MNKILIVGASVAGLTTAYWLAYYGFQVTIVELNSTLPYGGQVIGLHDHGLNVIAKMGISEQILEKKINIIGRDIVNLNGEKKEYEKSTYASNSQNFMQKIGLLRGDLVNIIADVTLSSPSVSILYGDSIREVFSNSSDVSVKFCSGFEQRFWLVIGADGVHSRVRKLCFDQSVDIYQMENKRFCQWSSPNFLHLENRAVFFHPAENINVGVTPIRRNKELHISARFQSVSNSFHNQTYWKNYTKELLLGYPKCIDVKLVETLNTCSDFYSDTLMQIRLSSWYNERVVLVGDAGYRSSPSTGMGTSNALLGAYILAGEIATHAINDPEKAFFTYQEQLKPSIESIQNLL